MKVKEIVPSINETIEMLERMDTLYLSKSAREELRSVIDAGIYLVSTLNTFSDQNMTPRAHITIKMYTILVDNVVTICKMSTYGNLNV